jgi:hypothetical protein
LKFLSLGSSFLSQLFVFMFPIFINSQIIFDLEN